MHISILIVAFVMLNFVLGVMHNFFILEELTRCLGQFSWLIVFLS